MTVTGWERVWSLFEQALAQPVVERRAVVERWTAEDPELRRAVLGMLAADHAGGSILDHSAVQQSRVEAASDSSQEPSDPADHTQNLPTGQFATGVPANQRFGPYRVLREVGRGGTSTAYLALRDDDQYRRQVVIRVVRDDRQREVLLERLRAERQILASLEHPNIARLYDGGATADGLPYFVMEYVDGLPIDDYCSRNGLAVEARLELFRKVCAAVHYAHRNLVVHRDLKPSNILVTAAGEPKLLDFGIAKVLNADVWSLNLVETAPWERMVTPSYASLEQIQGGPITTASDVYSLGVLLYKLLTGRLPFDFPGHSMLEIERILLDTVPAAPSAARRASQTTTSEFEPMAAELPPWRGAWQADLDAIVLTALRSKPQERYDSPAELATELGRLQAGLPVAARRGSWRYRAGKFVGRHRWGVVAALLFALLLSATAAVILRQSARVMSEPDLAQRERDRKRSVLEVLGEIVAYAEPFSAAGPDTSLREILLATGPILNGRLGAEPELRAEVLNTTGSMLLRLQLFDQAQAQLEEALRLRRVALGDQDRSVAETLKRLALVRKRQGQLEEAEGLARQAHQIVDRLVPREEELEAEILTVLASVLCSRHAFDSAEVTIEQAVRLLRESDLESPDLHMGLLDYEATVHTHYGRYQQAAEALRRSLEIRQQLYGQDHPTAENSLNNPPLRPLDVGLRRLPARRGR